MAFPPAQARTVRDILAQQPEAVNEVWCRKIFRHILLALERHHTLHLPHAPVSADTVGFDAVGDAILLPAEHAGEEGEAADVQALGALVHYAITREAEPLRPLRGRAQGYSESLVCAVDKCIAGDPGERPQTIAELRDLLGIVSLGPAVGPAAQPLMADLAPVSTQRRGIGATGKWERWLLIAIACVLLLAAAAALIALLRDNQSGDDFVLTLPKAVPPAKTLDPNETLVRPQPHVPAPAAPPSHPPAPAVVAPAPGAAHAPQAAAPTPAPATPARPSEKTTERPAAAQPARQSAPQARETTYKLLVKPWGTVYVDGEERGVSPPLKKLTLPAGRHVVRIDNPNYRDRVIQVEAGKRAAGRIEVDFSARQR